MVGYSVFLHHPDAIPWQQMASIIALHPKYTLADGRQMARRGVSKMLFQNCPLPLANKLRMALETAGCEALVIADKDLVPNPAAEHIRNADCLEQGLRLHEPFGGTEILPWDKIILLTAAVIRSRSELMGRAGLQGQFATPPPDRNGRSLQLDIYSLTRRPHKRINRRHFNYDYLGSRLRPNSLDNFVQMVNDLHQRCVKARFAPAVESIRNRDWQALPIFSTERDFDMDNLWYLQQLRAT